MSITIESAIGVPGGWPSRKDIVLAIAEKSEGYLALGTHIVQLATKTQFSFEVYEHDSQLQHAFTLAGRGSFTDSELREIGAHTLTIYLIQAGGSLDAARSILDAGCGLLKAGGIAVKVETTGIAHSRAEWFRLAEQKQDVRALYNAFVMLIGGKGTYYSCGMHNLGYRDAIVSGDIAADVGERLLDTFLLYALQEHPTIESGHTFSIDATSPHYRISAEECTTYEDTHPFHNPFGMWRLKPI